MSVLSKLLALEPVDEHIVKMIVEKVDSPPDEMDFAELGADLAEGRMSGQWAYQISSPGRVSPGKRRDHAKKVRTHAEKLFDSLAPTDANDGRHEFWHLIESRQHDQELPDRNVRPKQLEQILHFLQLVIRDADQIISAADADIENNKEIKGLRDSSAGLARIHDLFGLPKTVSAIIAWNLAPIFEAHFTESHCVDAFGKGRSSNSARTLCPFR